jgi:hypothetical protein
LLFTGELVDEKGEPVKQRFVKVFIANGWSIRTRTSDEGKYRLMLGAIGERKSSTPLAIDLGKRVDTTSDDSPYYAMYLLPPGYTPCPPAGKAAPAGKKAKKAKK